MKSTTNYRKFSFFKQNRAVTESRVGSLAKSISDIDMTENFPILVDEDFRIIDGQHRFSACKKLKKPIHYTIVKLNGDVDLAMSKINSNQRAWSVPDWINHYAEKGYSDYIVLRDAINDYKLPFSNASALVSNKSWNTATELKLGTWKAGSIPIEKMIKIYDDYKEIFVYASRSNFVRALVGVITHKEYNHSKMFPKISKNRFSMPECVSTGDYYKMFEQVLNKGLHEGTERIKFGNG